ATSVPDDGPRPPFRHRAGGAPAGACRAQEAPRCPGGLRRRWVERHRALPSVHRRPPGAHRRRRAGRGGDPDRPPRRLDHRRRRGGAPRLHELSAPERRRPDRHGAFDFGRPRLSWGGARARVLTRPGPLRVRLGHRCRGARGVRGADAAGGDHARARVGARRGVRNEAREDAAPNEGNRGRPLGPRGQGRARGGQGAGEADRMSRLDETFARLRARGERALVPYFTAGDPSLADTRRLVVEAARRGADAIELGVPFSDPLADGPVVQRAGTRALAAGTSVPRVLETVAALRAEVDVPLVLMTYYNPMLAFGLKAFARTAVDAGVNGAIVVDMPPEESEPLASEAAAAGLDLVCMMAPTSTPPRVRLIAKESRGFIYVVSLTGVTGERGELPADMAMQIAAIRRVTAMPVCVGFGISTPAQVAAVGRVADGAVVGSAIVRLVESRAGSASLVDDVGKFIAELKAPL